ncbi:MAG: hypothetical protein QM817_39795 [Archangium sp.]
MTLFTALLFALSVALISSSLVARHRRVGVTLPVRSLSDFDESAISSTVH